jgi:hypothetical protein
LKEAPYDFLVKQDVPADLDACLEQIKPKLVIVDSLRAFRPDVTEKNSAAGEWLKGIRAICRKRDCCFLIVHHLRKTSKDAPGAGDLESCNVGTWLQAMEGPRAFMNQTDVRVAVAEGDFNPASLRMKWSVRVRGDSPVMSVERVFNDEGEPIGYRHLTGARLLSPDKRAAFDRLPPEFSTGEAKAARRAAGLGDANDPTNKFLAECRYLRVIEKAGRGRWRKAEPVDEVDKRLEQVVSI